MHLEVGTYWHLLPEQAQARKAIWNAVNPHTGKRRIDEAFPRELRARTRDQEMFIEMKSGSTWQVLGSDNYDSLVGAPPRGVVFSEWALANPAAWAYLRPILAENGGWALFIYTPRGRNHGATFYEAASNDPDWYAERLSAYDTPVFTKETLDRERREYIREFGQDDGDSRFRQEYLCDFNAAVPGSYYGAEMNDAEKEGRIAGVPWEKGLPVHTAWDLGIDDSTAIWFVQRVGREWHFIDYIESSGIGTEAYVRQLKDKPYMYGEHLVPHDADQREKFTGKTIAQQMREMALQGTIRVLPREANIQHGINLARAKISTCWFDKQKCMRGVDALRQYRRAYDEKNRVYRHEPLHDWASHGADAFRYFAIGEPRAGGWSKIEQPKLAIV